MCLQQEHWEVKLEQRAEKEGVEAYGDGEEGEVHEEE